MKKSIIYLFLCTLLGYHNAYATLLGISGNFSINLPELALDPFSGNFSFTFNDSAVAPTGYSTFQDLPLSSLTLSPNYGGFDLSNTFGFIQFIDGNFDLAGIGVVSSSTDTTSDVQSNTNDFGIIFDQTLSISGYAVAREGYDLLMSNDLSRVNGSLSITQQVPEPSTVALFTLGLMGLTIINRRKGK